MHDLYLNGWHFNFKCMYATAIYPNYKRGFGLTEISYRMQFGKFDYRIMRWCPTRGWVEFFDVPEHKYNEMILEAYKSYIAEKELLGSL